MSKEGYGGDFFYCYSRRCALFIRAMGIPYVEIGTRPITKSTYSKFYKSERLNEVLELWNTVKYKFDDNYKEVQ